MTKKPTYKDAMKTIVVEDQKSHSGYSLDRVGGVPATIVEVALYKRLEEALAKVQRLEAKVSKMSGVAT